MALPDNPLTRMEQYLAKTAWQDVALPNVPLTRIEQYLAKIAGQDVKIPDVPLTRIEQYLSEIAKNGGGSSIAVEPLSVTENGTTTAPSGKAYSPVTVNVPIENPNSFVTVSGTVSNPWGDVTPSELASLLAHRNATADMSISIPNAGSHNLPVAIDNGDNPSAFIVSGLMYSPVVGQSTPSGGCTMYSVADGSLISSYLYVDGTLTDVSKQLARLPTELRIILHPMG